MNGTGQRAYDAFWAVLKGSGIGEQQPAWDQLAEPVKECWKAAECTPAIKPWWKSKTLWVNAAVLALAAAESKLDVLQGALPGGLFAWLAFVLPVLNAALRFLTSTGVGK